MAEKKRKSRTIQREQLDSFIDGLQDLPDKKKKPVLTARQAVSEIYPHLNDLLGRGYDYDDLVTLLEKSGIRIKRATLQQYFRAAKKEHENSDPETESLSVDEPPTQGKFDKTRSVVNADSNWSDGFLEMDEDL